MASAASRRSPVRLGGGDGPLEPGERRSDNQHDPGVPETIGPDEHGPQGVVSGGRDEVDVGGVDHDGDGGVEVYVGYLRRKIDVPFGRHSLQTVRGIGGYRMVAHG